MSKFSTEIVSVFGWDNAQSVNDLIASTRTELDPQNSHINLNKIVCIYTPVLRRRGRPWGSLASQPSRLGELSHSEMLSPETRWMIHRETASEVDLFPPHVYT